MKTNQLLSAFCMLLLLLSSCNNDDKTKTDILLDQEEYKVPLNEKFFTMTALIQPADISIEENGYTMEILALEYSYTGTDCNLYLPKIHKITPTQHPNEYQIMIDRSGATGTFALSLNANDKTEIVQKRFKISNAENEYNIHMGEFIKLSEQKGSIAILLDKVFNYYDDLELSRITLYAPNGKNSGKYFITSSHINHQMLFILINEHATNVTKGIWHYEIEGSSLKHPKIILRIDFEVTD